MSAVHPETPLGSPPATGHDFSCRPGAAHAEDCECWCHDVAQALATPATTPGQAAREVIRSRRAARGNHDCRSWAQLPEEDRDDMEAAAQAAITAGTGKILAQARQWKRERDEARARLADAERDCGEMRDMLTEARAAREACREALEDARHVLQSIALGTAGPPHKASVTADQAATRIRAALEPPS